MHHAATRSEMLQVGAQRCPDKVAEHDSARESDGRPPSGVTRSAIVAMSRFFASVLSIMERNARLSRLLLASCTRFTRQSCVCVTHTDVCRGARLGSCQARKNRIIPS